MSFEVEKKKHTDLWNKQPDSTSSIAYNEKQRSEYFSEKDEKNQIVKQENTKKKNGGYIAVSIFILIFAIGIFLPSIIDAVNGRKAQLYEKEHENDSSMLQNATYTKAFCENVVYPKGVKFQDYTAQSFLKPYKLIIYVDGSSTMNEYNMTAEMAFNVFRDLGTVTIIENDTGNEFEFSHTE